MSQFLGIVRYEYLMSTRRWGMWLAFGMVFLLYVTRTLLDLEGRLPSMTGALIWEYAGRVAINLNLFMPVIGGIVAADQMARDVRMGVAELQHSTPLPRRSYILGKYLGVLLSILTPQLIFMLLLSLMLLFGGISPMILLYTVAAFLIIVVPAFAFVTIFSLALPLVMPVRVYQVLFTGYWMWGNYLDPHVFPTISNTLLVSCGLPAYEGFFGGTLGTRVISHTPLDATLNLIVLAFCILAAMVALERYLTWQARTA